MYAGILARRNEKKGGPPSESSLRKRNERMNEGSRPHGHATQKKKKKKKLGRGILDSFVPCSERPVTLVHAHARTPRGIGVLNREGQGLCVAKKRSAQGADHWKKSLRSTAWSLYTPARPRSMARSQQDASTTMIGRAATKVRSSLPPANAFEDQP
eukprot:CAMPEP_0206584686 /NCGR_PEP_ID=MMETSP0325_2-20121206/35902_1 /ASSEMBLY_ACC=CAM_ASM_000347 /TAXON_ID=2866 /ORGANISM="Crypthecodinium cohnii, Strain Seligo" /LENGTH=155 /DNA_ID=CAMNT_0054091955 /DNA_START=83 /DNA_END=548 /DNA_ORIENTATION=-